MQHTLPLTDILVLVVVCQHAARTFSQTFHSHLVGGNLVRWRKKDEMRYDKFRNMNVACGRDNQCDDPKIW